MTVGLSIGSRSAAQPSGQARRLRPFKPCGDHVSWPAGIHTLGMTGSIPVVWTEVTMDRNTVWRQRMWIALAINGAHGAESRAAWCRLWERNEDLAESLGMRRAFRQ